MKIVKRHTPGFWTPNFFDDFMLKDWFADVENSVSHVRVNIKENDESYTLQLVVPGFAKEDFNVSLEESELKISAEIKKENKENTDNWTRREFATRSFEKRFNLPEDILMDKIEAEYHAGILELNIPKNMEEKARLNRSVTVK
jgi:HSP20 family protein